jgi:hypothetical protein
VSLALTDTFGCGAPSPLVFHDLVEVVVLVEVSWPIH